MRCRVTTTLTVLLATLVVAAPASGQAFHIVNLAHFPQRKVQRIERTLERTHGRVQFLTGAQARGKWYWQVWPVWLETRAQRLRHGGAGQPPAWYSCAFLDWTQPWPYGIVQSGDRTGSRVRHVVLGMVDHHVCPTF